MNDNLSENTRLAARVILIDDQDRILYFHAREPKSGKEFWVMPGGGLDEGERYEDAAIRETFEETGIHVA